jgi:hypothetical protein
MTRLDDITKQAQESLAPSHESAWQRHLWDAINEYAESVGGVPGRHAYGNTPRMDAVVKVHQALTALPDLAKAWLAVCEVLEEMERQDSETRAYMAAVRAAILRRLSK